MGVDVCTQLDPSKTFKTGIDETNRPALTLGCSQLFFNPLNRGTAEIPTKRIPQTLGDAWRHGYLPNVEKWLPGDLILIGATFDHWSVRQTWQAQGVGEAGFPWCHARWYHAAVYVGNYHLVEAEFPAGVVCRSLLHYVKNKHLIRVRRAPNLSEAMRYQIALNAMQLISLKYDWKAVARKRVKGWFSDDPLSHASNDQLEKYSRFCSQLYADAYNSALIGQPHGALGTSLWPAELSATDLLVDVPFGWIQLDKPQSTQPGSAPQK